MTALGDFGSWWPSLIALVSGTALGFFYGLIPASAGEWR
jgi:hypothetical protein